MASVTTSNGSVILIDEDDLPAVQGRALYANTRGRVQMRVDGRCVLLYRYLLQAPRGMTVDHINGNPLDNRRANLRLCTQGENTLNRRIDGRNKTGFKGVYVDKRTGHFRSAVWLNKKRYWLGSFETAEAAGQAYLDKAAELHGQFFAGVRAVHASQSPFFVSR